MELEELTRSNFSTVYKVFHNAEYGFGGNTSIWIAVKNETDTRIEGRKFGPMNDWPGQKIVVMKENVAGWEVDATRYRAIPEEVPSPSEEEIREAYVRGEIDEGELESQLEQAELS